MRNNNIAFVHRFFPKGGAEMVTSHIAKYLVERGYTIYVFATEINLEQLASDHSKIKLIKLPDSVSDSRENAIFIIENIKKFRIDFLFSKDIVNQWTYIGANTDCKMVLTHHSTPLWEVTHELSNKKMDARGSFFKKLKWYFYQIPKTFVKDPKKRVSKYYRYLYRIVDVYTVLCDDYRQRTAEIVGDDKKLYTLINPTIEPSEEVNFNKKKQVIFIGRLTYADKRVDRLISAWSKVCHKFSDWELLIIGEGEEEKNLRQQAVSLNLINYRFCGFTTDIASYLQSASILCLTSSYEGWPLSLTEAQTYGVVPVSMMCCDGVKAILSPNGVNGVIVDSFSVNKFARKLSEIMVNDELRSKISRNVVEKAKEYRLENVGHQWEDMLNKLYGEI